MDPLSAMPIPPAGRPVTPLATGDALAVRRVAPVLLLVVAVVAPCVVAMVRPAAGAIVAAATAAVVLLSGMRSRTRSVVARSSAATKSDRASDPAAAMAADSADPLEALRAWSMDAAAEALVVTDLRARIVLANGAARDLLGPEVVAGATIAADDCFAAGITQGAEFRRALGDLYRDPEAEGRGEIAFAEGGRVTPYEWESRPVHDASGDVIGRGFVVRDRSQAHELTSLKREFLSTVTHELRTPLTSVKGSLQLVLGKATALSTIERELLAISLKNTDRLIRLINDMLDISQLELGKMELSFTPIAPASLIEETIAGLRSYAAGRDITITDELDTDLAPVSGDRDRLIQVLTNLLSNAVKFSPAGGKVLVHATHDARELRIAVRDWGVGIAANDHGRLFQRFQRLKAGRSEEPGTGLGLAISKAIVDRHGGRILVESEEAAGSTFTLVLPLATIEPAEGGDHAVGVLATARPTILLVDDDPDFGTVLEVSLAPRYRLLRVERGVQALDVARAERPDLVLLDVVLPDLSGYDVLRILQHSDATRHIPVVMLTVQPERVLARGLGAADVVAKPVDVAELERVITKTLRAPSPESGLRIALGPMPSRAREPLVAALEASGHAVFTAADAWGLVQCADEHDADVAVVEAVPAAAQGTVAFLRGHATTRRLPLVLLTAETAGAVGSGCTPVAPCVADSELVRVVETTGRRLRPAS
jgi:signal transduction histidine kinase/DNA-binding response OmpR family regulator